MRTLRILGLVLVLYGGVMLLLLMTPAREWALQHSIAEMVSRTDRRVGNTVTEADMPMAVAGSAVLIFAGLWIAVLVPWVMNRSRAKMSADATSTVGTNDQQ